MTAVSAILRNRRGPDKYQFGIILSLISIGIFFAALVIAFAITIPPEARNPRIKLPLILWFSTGLLALSSITLEYGRYELRRARLGGYQIALWATLLLGSAFVGCQLFSWWSIEQQGLMVQGHPQVFAFYVLTGVHAAHLIGGIGGLIYLNHRLKEVDSSTEQSLRRQRRFTAAGTLYWHSMGILWVILFSALYLWSGK